LILLQVASRTMNIPLRPDGVPVCEATVLFLNSDLDVCTFGCFENFHPKGEQR
jgi:hypothetical protein